METGVKPHSTVPGSVSQTVAKRIKQARLDAQLTQQELAARIGVRYQQLQKYEAGVNQTSPDRLRRIADAVGRPISYFFLSPAADILADDGVVKEVFEWKAFTPAARSLLAALVRLSPPDAQIVCAIVQRLAVEDKVESTGRRHGVSTAVPEHEAP
jgi:transcriptional regulator with XRE-family HTH domain